MIEIKIWPDDQISCEDCKRKSSESIEASIRELHDKVYQQGYREGYLKCAEEAHDEVFNEGLKAFRLKAQELIEQKKRTINKGDLLDIQCELVR